MYARPATIGPHMERSTIASHRSHMSHRPFHAASGAVHGGTGTVLRLIRATPMQYMCCNPTPLHAALDCGGATHTPQAFIFSACMRRERSSSNLPHETCCTNRWGVGDIRRGSCCCPAAPPSRRVRWTWIRPGACGCHSTTPLLPQPPPPSDVRAWWHGACAPRLCCPVAPTKVHLQVECGWAAMRTRPSWRSMTRRPTKDAWMAPKHMGRGLDERG